MRPFLAFFLCCGSFLLGQTEDTYVKVGDISLWYETFGKKEDPAVLLIAGSGCQGIMWPIEFCERLAHEGFFVIRYDHRDMGLSSQIDYKKNPYDLMDLAKDAIGILDGLQIQKARVVGHSMGGLIATLIGAHFPNQAQSIILMTITSDFSTLLNPTEDNPSSLPKPKKECLAYLNYAQQKIDQIPTLEEKVALLVHGWEILNGSKIAFDKELYEELVTQSFQRMQNPQGNHNQTLAMTASLQQLKEALPLIQVPTHVVHGTEDPFFSVEHGEALAKAIPRAQLSFFKGMGHCLNSHFYDDLIQVVKKN
jgi:pimeloyl-ACP methyl ester carboxylesterase